MKRDLLVPLARGRFYYARAQSGRFGAQPEIARYCENAQANDGERHQDHHVSLTQRRRHLNLFDRVHLAAFTANCTRYLSALPVFSGSSALSLACPTFLSGSMCNFSPSSANCSGLISPTMLMNTACRLPSVTRTTIPCTVSLP